MKRIKHSQIPWYRINNPEDIPSPALLISPKQIKTNIRRMIKIAGNLKNLRPHVKSHKMAEVTKLQIEMGIEKFKTSTISETEMVANCGAKEILLAIQPVGPNLDRFFTLKKKFRNIRLSCIVDSEEIITSLSDLAISNSMETHVWLDINNGMNRTGIVPGENAAKLIQKIITIPMLKLEGIHVYDGHITEKDISLRKKIYTDSFEPVINFIDKLKPTGIIDLKVVAGGTPTFPFHALRKDIECSPGTTVLWDYGYNSSFPDLDFHYAAVLLTRVISKPGKDLLCLDLGHKALASEMPQPRAFITDIMDYNIIGHSEEHMVIQTPEQEKFNIGDHLYCIPQHICPTVDNFDTAFVVHRRRVTEEWDIIARKRKITY